MFYNSYVFVKITPTSNKDILSIDHDNMVYFFINREFTDEHKYTIIKV